MGKTVVHAELYMYTCMFHNYSAFVINAYYKPAKLRLTVLLFRAAFRHTCANS